MSYAKVHRQLKLHLSIFDFARRIRGNQREPRKANVEGIVEEHLTRSLCLRLTFLRENREVGAALDPPFRIPRALPVPHQHDSLGRLDRRKLAGTTKFGGYIFCFFDGRCRPLDDAGRSDGEGLSGSCELVQWILEDERTCGG